MSYVVANLLAARTRDDKLIVGMVANLLQFILITYTAACMFPTTGMWLGTSIGIIAGSLAILLNNHGTFKFMTRFRFLRRFVNLLSHSVVASAFVKFAIYSTNTKSTSPIKEWVGSVALVLAFNMCVAIVTDDGKQRCRWARYTTIPFCGWQDQYDDFGVVRVLDQWHQKKNTGGRASVLSGFVFMNVLLLQTILITNGDLFGNNYVYELLSGQVSSNNTGKLEFARATASSLIGAVETKEAMSAEFSDSTELSAIQKVWVWVFIETCMLAASASIYLRR